MDYGFWADITAIVHFAFFSFVIVGQILILVGILWRWQWIRNIWFRATHLLAIVLVGAEAVMGMNCPLTDLERFFRAKAGQTVSDASFMARLVNEIMFYQFPDWVFRIAHISFALLVIATFILAPPRWPRFPRSP